VAFCFLISSRNGETLALGLGASFAAVACIASFSRLFVAPAQQASA
jgi:DHA2 family multidrug resistance protein-like MFS transporter